MRNSRIDRKRRGLVRSPWFASVAALLGILGVAATASAAPIPVIRAGATGAAPGSGSGAVTNGGFVGTPLYDNIGSSAVYYAGQGGNEAIDDLHLTGGGTLDWLSFEYLEPATGGTLSATVRIFGNPSGLDLAATPLIGTYTVTGLSSGRHVVSIPLPDAPTVEAHVWVGVQFSSTTAGLIIHGTPSVGTSHDYYLENDQLYTFGDVPANFALQLLDSPSHTLTVSVAGSGSVTRNPDQPSYVDGAGVQLTPVPAAHWHFVGWSGDASGTDIPLTIVMNADKSVTATFAIDTHTLTYVAGPNGTVSGATSQTVDHGASGTAVNAVPDPGFRFVRWSDGVLTAARTDANVTADLSVTATFAVTDLACNGGFETDLAGWARYSNVTITRVAPGRTSGWSMQIRSGSSSDCGIDDSPNCIQGVTAGDRFRFSVWVKAGSASSLDNKVKLKIYEYDGSSQVGDYALAELKLGTAWKQLTLDYVVRRSGTVLSERILYDPDGSGEHMFLDDVSIEPLAPPVRFTITATAGTGGSITPSGAVLVNQGDSRAFSIAPNAGYRIQDVLVDAVSVGAVASYTFPNVQAAHTIAASFAVIPPGQNLVADPSFESGITNWTTYGNATLSWSGAAHSGLKSLQIAGSSSFGCDDKPNWVTRVAGIGVPYRFRAWVKAANATSRGKVKIRVYEYEGSSQVGSTVYSAEIPLTLDWQLLTATHTVRRANTTLSMRVTDAPASSSVETFLVDDVSIELLGTSAAIVEPASARAAEPALEFERPTVYPNPARGGAMLALSLARRGALSARLYDVAGRLIRVLVDDPKAAAGTHRFAVGRHGGDHDVLGAGIYFYRAEVEGVRYHGRFVILE